MNIIWIKFNKCLLILPLPSSPLYVRLIFSCFPLSWRRQWHPTPVLLPGKSHGLRSLVGCSPWGHWGLGMTERLHFTFHFHALEKEMATHSSVLAWRIPGIGEPGGLPSMGSHRVGHDWRDLAAAVDADATYCVFQGSILCCAKSFLMNGQKIVGPQC